MANWNDCVTALLTSSPFFGTLLMRFKHVSDERVPTAYVTFDTIGYNRTWFESLSTDVGVFVIAHEVMHAVYEHCGRIKHYIDTGIGPDGHAFDQPRYNMAADYVINDALKQSGFVLWPKALWDARYNCDLTPEEVYCRLPKGKDGQGDGVGDDGQPMDGHLPEGGVPAVGPAEVQQAANVVKATRGTLPAGIDRLLGEMTRPTVNPWKRLRRAITTSMAGRDATTWNRLHRRLIVRGIGAPGPTAVGSGHIGIVVDTSGSIGDEMLRLFAGHMAAILDEARPRRTSLVWTDARVHRVDTLRGHADLRRTLSQPVPGGGGTDMPVGVDRAFELGCDCVVVLTDGCTPFGEGWAKPVMWAITTDRLQASNGMTVNIA